MGTYSPPEDLILDYSSNASIYVNEAMNNSVFKLSKIFLDSVLTDKILPEDILEALIEDPDSLSDILIEGDDFYLEWIEIAKANSGFFAAIIFGLMMTSVFWIVGLIWCIGR
jgi:hypothetical protein